MVSESAKIPKVPLDMYCGCNHTESKVVLWVKSENLQLVLLFLHVLECTNEV